jgi:hypothetical protein
MSSEATPLVIRYGVAGGRAGIKSLTFTHGAMYAHAGVTGTEKKTCCRDEPRHKRCLYVQTHCRDAGSPVQEY